MIAWLQSRYLQPLFYVAGLLSCHGEDVPLLQDMLVAMDDLATVTFTLVEETPEHREVELTAKRSVLLMCLCFLGLWYVTHICICFLDMGFRCFKITDVKIFLKRKKILHYLCSLLLGKIHLCYILFCSSLKRAGLYPDLNR